MRVTVKFLEEHNACEEQLELFKKFLGKRKYVLTTPRNIQLAEASGLHTPWVAKYMKGVVTCKANTGVYWYKDGELHRVGGPAVTSSNGYCAWYKNGELHRMDGPAVKYASGLCVWYEDGKFVKEGRV